MPDRRLDILDEYLFRPLVFDLDPAVDEVELRKDLVMQNNMKWVVLRFQFNLKMVALDLVRSENQTQINQPIGLFELQAGLEEIASRIRWILETTVTHVGEAMRMNKVVRLPRFGNIVDAC